MFWALTVLGTSLGTNHSCNYVLMDKNGVGSINKGAVYLITTESCISCPAPGAELLKTYPGKEWE